MKKFFRYYTRMLLGGAFIFVFLPSIAGDGLLYHMINDGITPVLRNFIVLLLTPYLVGPVIIKSLELNRKRTQTKKSLI